MDQILALVRVVATLDTPPWTAFLSTYKNTYLTPGHLLSDDVYGGRINAHEP